MQDIVETSAAPVFNLLVKRPLVSVGIPTFNRPEGLRRTLRFICNQTYSNLEILVSDNASPGSETQKIVQGFAEIDKRVTYFRQPTNIGAVANFRAVLEKASGDYFMWAADDDEWDPAFIETCLSQASPSCSVMTRFNTVFRTQHLTVQNPLPQLSPDVPLFQNVENYFALMQPNLFYGLHPRTSILFTLKGRYFDFHDCYVVLRIILESNFRTIDTVLYSAGIDSPTYEVKYADAAKRKLEFWPFFFHSSIAIAGSLRLSVVEKLRLWLRLVQLVRNLSRHHAALAS